MLHVNIWRWKITLSINPGWNLPAWRREYELGRRFLDSPCLPAQRVGIMYQPIVQRQFCTLCAAQPVSPDSSDGTLTGFNSICPLGTSGARFVMRAGTRDQRGRILWLIPRIILFCLKKECEHPYIHMASVSLHQRRVERFYADSLWSESEFEPGSNC